MDIKKYNDYIASTILFLCVVAALTFFIMMGMKSRNSTASVHYVDYTIQVDNIGKMTAESQRITDSLILVIEQHEHLLNDKYQYVLEQRSNVEDYLTWCGFLLTIVLSVFGFFGYRSLHGIEDRIKDSVGAAANQKAAEKADEVSRQKFNEYKSESKQDIVTWKDETKGFLKEDLTNKVKSLTRQQGFKTAIQEQMEDAYSQKISERLHQIDVFEQRVASIESELKENSLKVNRLSERIDRPQMRRRSLAELLVNTNSESAACVSEYSNSETIKK